MSPKITIFVAMACFAFGADWLSKAWIIENLHRGEARPVIESFFYLTNVRNPGAAFSMFATSPEWFRTWFFPIVTGIAIAMIFSFLRNLSPGDRLAAFALGSILGGATGNLYDRLFRGGEVVDFLHVRLWTGYVWPDFNFADSFIVIGVALLVFELFTAESQLEDDPHGSDEPASDVKNPPVGVSSDTTSNSQL